MAIPEQTLSVNEARLEPDKDFDSEAFAKEVMKSVGADFHEDDPVFHTNAFRMHCYKILPCTKHFCHDWSVCPFAHFSERAKRRNPKDVKYTAIACPDMKKGENCPRGDHCPYSHNTFEYWLHPTRYRTRLCRDGEGCNRKICFFAHKPEEVRVPSSRPSLPVVEDLEIKATDKQEALGIEALSANNTFDQQLQSILQTASLSGDGRVPLKLQKTEEMTFVDQVLNGLLPVPQTNCNRPPPPSPVDLSFSNAQSLSFDSCSRALGFNPGADFLDGVPCQSFSTFQPINPGRNFNYPSLGAISTTPTQQYPAPDPFSSTGFLQGQTPYTNMGINPTDLGPLTGNQAFQGNGGVPVETVDQYTEMLRLLSTLQMSNSPTSVLANGVASLGQYRAMSVDGSSSNSGNSGIGLTDQELDKRQIGGISNSLMSGLPPGPAYYGMTI